MEKQVVQFLKEHEETGDNRNVHRQLIEYAELPAEVNGEQLHLDPAIGQLFTLTYQGREVLLTPENGVELQVNQTAIEKSVLLKNGDRIQIGDAHYLFYVRRLESKLSFSSQLLARLAASIIIIFVVLELFLMFGGPRMMMSRRSMWEKARNREKLQLQLDAMHYLIKSTRADSPFEQAILNEFMLEIERMGTYVQANELKMRARTRRAISSDLERMQHLLALIRKPGPFGEPKPWDVEQAVKQLIKENNR